ncbi:hypothetical protein VN97_g8139 [Penicillium thymicola]|uniref:Uncharacterized protein n=1 Tax=Penicillium thymicola TaxID=293382 RepID=A0AAI9TDR6_PENTH|nr:hypothetical protein VN97_g8139 [Penicillium thymicola]
MDNGRYYKGRRPSYHIHTFRQSHRFHCPLTVYHYLSSSILTVQIAIHPHRFPEVFIFSAGKYSGILTHQYY